MTDHETTTLWLASFRYYLGRMTYAVGDFCDLLRKEWPTLPIETKHLIQRELDDAYAHDEMQRAREEADGMHRLCKQLGHDCDREQWLRVRSLWETPNAKSPA